MQVTRQALDPEQIRALELIERSESFLLTGHVRPDGDCLGAQGALARVLTSLGKNVVILNPDQPDPRFDYLLENGPYDVYDGGSVPRHDVCVLLDFNEPTRCGPLHEPLAAADSKKLVIDHHPHEGEPWWDACFVDPRASATGLLVWRIGRLLGAPVDAVLATAVFTSLATDTGWFKYSNTDAETMAVASEIVSAGVDPAMMYARLYQRNEPGEPGELAAILDRLRYHGDGRIAVVDEPLGSEGRTLGDTDAVLDIVRSVGPVEVVLYLRELPGGICKLSARSKTDYDVNALARRFGGGGHVKASGATIPGQLDDVRERMVASVLADFESRSAPSGSGS